MKEPTDATSDESADPQWLFLAYKVPSEPSSNRILIWRELKHMGAYYPQQAVCILPGRKEIRSQIGKIRAKVTEMGGTDTYLEIPYLPEVQHNELVGVFIDLAARQYGEIVEECDAKFIKQIEFARFRENYTFEEAEEIRQDLGKIQRQGARPVGPMSAELKFSTAILTFQFFQKQGNITLIWNQLIYLQKE